VKEWLRDWGPWLGLAAAVAAIKLAVGSRWGLLEDEAYHWLWSLEPALGYFDQPPLVAWVMAAVQPLLGRSEVALRAPFVLACVFAPLVVARSVPDRLFVLTWCWGLPALFWLGDFAIPDAGLIAAWTLAVGAALRGGQGWIWAGLAAGIAANAKHSGLVLFPMLVVAAGPEARRREVGLGALLWALSLVPNLAWNAGHGGVSLWFPLRENVLEGHGGSWFGPVAQLIEQIGASGGLPGLAFGIWAVVRAPRALRWRDPDERTLRIGWWTSVPLFLAFSAAALWGRPEAHWPAPGWIGAGVGLAVEVGALKRAAELGTALAAMVSAALLLQTAWPVFPVQIGLIDQLALGPQLGAWVRGWAEPSVAEGREDPLLVVTERYQEAGWVRYYGGVEAVRLPGCGRDDQFDLWAADGSGPRVDPGVTRALFVRPLRSGATFCFEPEWRRVSDVSPSVGLGPHGDPAQAWQIVEVSR
jgi:4-amino-4-deoxy-L-arabinose transferase-like glycosyltransferase